MFTPELISLYGNAIALVTLGWKTLYDLVWNKRRFEREMEGNPLEAARAKRERRDKTTAITFLLLAISYLIFIGGTFMPDQETDTNFVSREEFEKRMRAASGKLPSQMVSLEQRVERIEEFLFPPGGPTSPSKFSEKLLELDEKLKALQGRELERDKKFDELVEIVAEVREILETQQTAPAKVVRRIGGQI